MVRRVVVDLGLVRASCQRLDALAMAHPELLDDAHRSRLTDALADLADLADLKGCDDDDEEEAEEETPHHIGEGEDHRSPSTGRRDDDGGDPYAG